MCRMAGDVRRRARRSRRALRRRRTSSVASIATSRPIFFTASRRGGVVPTTIPFVRQGWSDNQLGDFWIGAKMNLRSQWRQQPAAFALRGIVKLPTAKDDEEGVGTGKADFAVDAIVSKEINERVELSGFGGFIFRGDPDDVDLSNGFRWGFGVGLPTRQEPAADRGTARRVVLRRHARRCLAPLVGEDGSLSPLDVEPRLAVQRVGRADVAGQQRHVRRRRPELAHGDGRPVGVRQLRGRDAATRSASSSGSAITPASASTCRRRRRHRRRRPAGASRTARRRSRRAANPCTVEVGRTSTVTRDAQRSRSATR